MIRKFVDRSKWIRVKEFRDKTIKEDSKEFKGYLYAINVKKVNKKFDVTYDDEEFNILDDGYTWIQIVPLNSHYTITIMFDENKEIVQWYIDITNMNGIDADGRIFFDDMYLNIVITKNRKVLLRGEEELNNALNNFVITSEQYKNAYKQARDIMDKIKDDGIEKITVKSLMILDRFDFYK